MIRFISGVLLALLFLLAGYILEGGDVLHLVVFTPFLVTFFVPLFGVLAIWSLKDCGQAWHDAFHPAEPTTASKSVEFWKFVEFTSYLAGVIASLMGGILILNSLGVSNAQWNISLSYGLVAPLYGCLFGLIARILRVRVDGGRK